jgi:HPt (histidine-containing phosphotransfer) domain-containing protein
MIDERLLTQYAELMGTAGVADMLTTFDDNVGGYVDHIQWLIKQRDEAGMRSQAHKLKGACRSVGLTELARSMERLERDSWDWQTLEQLLAQWVQQLPMHQQQLKRWLNARRVQ